MQVLLNDPEPLLFHAELVLRDGKPVGYVRAASYGHTLGGAVGLAMVEGGEPIDRRLDATAPSGRSRSPAGCTRRGRRCGRSTTRPT